MFWSIAINLHRHRFIIPLMINDRDVLLRDGNSFLPVENKWVLFQGPLYTILRRHIIENRHPQHAFKNGDVWTQFNFQVSNEPLTRIGFICFDGRLPEEGRYSLFI